MTLRRYEEYPPFDHIPMLDRDSAEKLGDRKLGQLADMVSQFEVADNYSPTQLQGSSRCLSSLRFGTVECIRVR